MRAIGLMSGTSLDGIDAALVDVVPRGDGYGVELVRFSTVPFEAEMHARLRAALPPNAPSPAEVAALDRDLGASFAAAAELVADGSVVDYVACHGLTLYHDGAARITQQIGDPYLIRERVAAPVVFDFRRADCAAGGNGAPLVPYVDARLFASADRDVVALNIGGIANVTVLERGAPPERAFAWDTGPGNMLIDAFVFRRTNGAERFDRDGSYASRGAIDERAVRELVAREAFFLMIPPPKSTGRERFGEGLLVDHAGLFDDLSLADGCATLADFTATTIADSLALYAPREARTIASGGGTHNPFLMDRLALRLAASGMELVNSRSVGVDPDAKEAIAFALLGYETLRGRPSNVPRATGAAHPAVLGAIAPFELARVFAKMQAEGAANGRE